MLPRVVHVTPELRMNWAIVSLETVELWTEEDHNLFAPTLETIRTSPSELAYWPFNEIDEQFDDFVSLNFVRLSQSLFGDSGSSQADDISGVFVCAGIANKD